MKKVINILVCISIIIACISVNGYDKKVKAAGRVLFDSFDDYTQADYDQTKAWGMQGVHAICESGPGVAPGSSKSLKIGSRITASEAINFWTKHRWDTNVQNWTGAKYVQIYIQSLNDRPAELGFYITDITDQNEKKQEHYTIMWDSAVVLEDMNGKKSKVVSTEGMTVSIPAKFKGSIKIPLDTKTTLEIPGWLNAEPSYAGFANRKLDFNRIFKVSPIIPTGEKNANFLIDDVYHSSDNDVNEFLSGQTTTSKTNTNSNTATNNNSTSNKNTTTNTNTPTNNTSTSDITTNNDQKEAPQENEKVEIKQVYEDNTTKIKLYDTNAYIKDGSTLKVDSEAIKPELNKLVADVSSNYKLLALYDISLVNAEENIKPDGNIRIAMPIPKEAFDKDIRVVKIDSNNVVKGMLAVKTGDSVLFETDDTSRYGIVQVDKKLATLNNPTNPNMTVIISLITLIVFSLITMGASVYILAFKKIK